MVYTTGYHKGEPLVNLMLDKHALVYKIVNGKM